MDWPFCWRRPRQWLRTGWLVAVTGLLVADPSPAAFEQRGAEPVRMSRGAGLASDPFSPFATMANPAAGSFIVRSSFGAAMSRSFGLRELDRVQAAVVAPLGPVLLSGWGAGFGRELYTESTAGVTCSAQLPGSLVGGIGITTSQISLKDHGSDIAAGLDAGLFSTWQGHHAGISVRNAVHGRFDQFHDYRPPKVALAAVAVELTDGYAVIAETEWMEGRAPSLRGGVEARVIPGLSLRAGYDGATDRIHAGLHLTWQGWNVLAAGDRHPTLSWSQAWGVTYQPGAPALDPSP